MAELHNNRGESFWAIAVLLLGLPSVLFVVSHVIVERLTLQLPEWLNLLLAWVLTITGMLGVFTTACAVLVAIAGSFVRGVPASRKVLMWVFAGVSLLAFAYQAQIRP